MKLGSLFSKKKKSPEVDSPSWQSASVTPGNERSNIQLGAHRNAPKGPTNLLAGIQNHAVSLNESAGFSTAGFQPINVDVETPQMAAPDLDDILAELGIAPSAKQAAPAAPSRGSNIRIGAHRAGK
ncbi:MAG: hypothetical protein R3Y24_14980 [Eubacteriales bacterium]